MTTTVAGFAVQDSNSPEQKVYAAFVYRDGSSFRFATASGGLRQLGWQPDARSVQQAVCLGRHRGRCDGGCVDEEVLEGQLRHGACRPGRVRRRSDR